MFKSNLLLTVCILTVATLQAQNYEWTKSLGGILADYGNAISLDGSGNVYTTGSFQRTVDFDPGAGTANLTATGDEDIFVQKLDVAGNFLWAKSFGGTSIDYGFSINVDASDNVYITGSYSGTVDFDPGAGTAILTSAGDEDIFVLKLDAAGNFLWAKSFGGTSYDYGYAIHVDASGNVYIAGSFSGTVDFDPNVGTSNLTSAGDEDIFVQKLDAAGNFQWAKSFGGTSSDYGTSIHVDASGNVYTTGSFRETVDFDPGAATVNLTSAGDEEIFVQKLDAAGNFIWAKSIGGTTDDVGNSIFIDASGNIYLTGIFSGTVDFDPGAGTANLTSVGWDDIFIQKMDDSGNFIWAKSFGGTSNDFGNSISVDALGNVYTTGLFSGTVDFDPSASTTMLTSTGMDDIFVQKLDAAGNFLWAESFGGSFSDYGFSIDVDASGNIYTTGAFQRTVDFDPGSEMDMITSEGFEDVFVQKISQCSPTTGTDVIKACESYTWIDGVTYTASNNTVTDTLMNAAGCDSIVTLDLTIHKSTTGMDVITACDSYTWIDGITYTASINTARHTLTNAVGCDSVVTLDLTINSVSDISTTLNGMVITANNTNATYQWLDCSNNYEVLFGENNQSFIAPKSGRYAVALTENACVDTSACVDILTVSTNENNFGEQLSAYPNPTNGNFSIDLGNSNETANISIIDISGKEIYTKSFYQTKIANLSIQAPAGIYTVMVLSEKRQAIFKLIKN